MSAKNWRGISDDRLNTKKDIRTFTQKISDSYTHRKASVFPIAVLAASAIPAIQSHAAALMLSSLPICYFLNNVETKVVIEKPYYHTKDHDDGFFFFGNDIDTGREVWITDSEARRHILIMGTTGAGKSESLIGLVANSLAQSSAFTYVDGKADTGLFAKIFSLCRRFGREDDLLVINYMLGTLNADVKRERKLSNTLNPFATLTASSLAELVTSLLPSGGSSDGIWKDRASVYMTALITALCDLRDEGHLLLDVNVIREYFTLEKTIQLSKDTRIKEKRRQGLISYVLNLPGYREDRGADQESTVFDQHGYVVMQFQPCFGMLSDTYGHIMKTQLADTDVRDVVLQRRILCVLLPALEKSPSNLANLGKVIISSIKNMMAGALGAELEGLTEYTIDAKPTNGRTYQCCFDEYGYYSVEGAAVMPAQARGIGFSLIFAGQDYQAFKKGSEDEAASIKANCAIKMCMTLEDATETADIFTKGAGEGYRAVETGVEREAGMAGSKYVSSKTVNFEKVQRIDELDLKEQAPGSYHLINKEIIVRGTSFYANPAKPKEVRVNSFVRVKPPEYDEVTRVKDSIFTLRDKFDNFTDEYAAKLDKAWTNSISIDSSELVGALNFANGSSVKKAAAALAIRRHKIDIIDRDLVLRVKELEDYVNSKSLNDDELFSDDDDFDESMFDDDIVETKPLTKRERLLELIGKNQTRLDSLLDLENNPITKLKNEVEKNNSHISELSIALINRWSKRGAELSNSDFVDTSLQDELIEVSNQQALIAADDLQSELSQEIDSIKAPDLRELDDMLEEVILNEEGELL